MMMAQFKNTDLAAKFGVEPKEVGEVVATETRDSIAFLCVRFTGVEVNGLPSDEFDIQELEIQEAE
jgi:hypothetical protein